jgi:hypothetical protein
MKALDLENFQPLWVVGRGPISSPIEALEGGPTLPDGTRPSHVGYVLEGFVYEMTWPVFRRITLGAWLAEHADVKVWTAPLTVTLSIAELHDLDLWSCGRLGAWYDIPELLRFAGVALWQRLLMLLGRAPRALEPNGVCSVNYVLAAQAIGLWHPPPAVTSFTPALTLHLPFLGQPELVEA